MGDIIESRAIIGEDWLHIRFENHDSAWVVAKVGGGLHRKPMTRLEAKREAREVEAKRRAKVAERKEKIKAMKAAQAASRGRRNKGKAIIKLKDEEEVIIIAPGEYGADTVRMLHPSVQKKLTATVYTSPFRVTEEDADLLEIEVESEVQELSLEELSLASIHDEEAEQI